MFQKCFQFLNLAEKTIREQSLIIINIRARRSSPWQEKVITMAREGYHHDKRSLSPWQEKVITMARDKELTNSQKDLIVKLWKEGKSYGKCQTTWIFHWLPLVHSLQGLKIQKCSKPKKNSCSTEIFFEIFEEVNV